MKILLLGLSLITLTSFAHPQPVVCPAVDKLQEVGLSNNLVQDNDGKWYAGRSSESYGTHQKWTFVIGGISAPTKQKALLEANEALATLSFKAGPIKAPANKLLCLYDNDDNLPSGAVTPPVNHFSIMRELS